MKNIMKTEELRKRGEKQLKTLLRKRQKELADLCLKSSAGQITNHSQIGKTKKEIARILTILNQ